MRSTMGSETAAVVAIALIISALLGIRTASGTSDADIFTKATMVFHSMASTAATLPNEIHYIVPITDARMTLKLIKNNPTEAPIPVFTSGKSNEIIGVDIQDDVFKGISFYQDTEGKAAVSMRMKATGSSVSYEMEGLVFYNNSMYYIRPFMAATRSVKQDDGIMYTLKKVGIYDTTADVIAAMTTSYVTSGSLDRRLMSKSPVYQQENHRLKRGIPDYVIDVIYVTDYSMYQRVLEFKKQKSPVTTATDIMKEMRYYLAHVSNAVDMRYKSINTSAWTLRTKLVGFYMATTPEQSSWTEAAKSSLSPSGRFGVDISAALKNFQIWVTGTTFPKTLPSFDHAVLFTGYDAYTENKGVRSYSVAGLAYLGTLCGPSSVSVAEYSGALAEASTVTHELGHSLGARHDGDGNACLPASMYIMAATTVAASNGNEQNFYRFSDCSISYIKNMVATLSKKSPNCLEDSGSYFNLTEWNINLAISPGTKYNPNDLCRQSFGPRFEVCGGAKYGEKICSELYCHDTTSTASGTTCIASSAAGRGVDGTSCGNRKWCKNGICTYDPIAPEGSETCPLGDLSSTQRVYSNQPYTCSNMPSSYCYDQGVFNTCCATCAKLRDASRPGCEYGDKGNCAGLSLRSCSIPSNQGLCCKHCQGIKLSIPGCEWGDSFSNCGDLYPLICSRSPKECCATCSKYNGTMHPIVG